LHGGEDGEELLAKYKFVDFVLGPNRENEISDIIFPLTPSPSP